tara:strand:+ start:603 stop:809 length:207 start_codon:yes stop_codon:yes gene_type:complete
MYQRERILMTIITMIIYILLSNPEVYEALDSAFESVNDNEWFLTFIHSILFGFVFYLSTYLFTEVGIC